MEHHYLTVADLIELLKLANPKAPVFMCVPYGHPTYISHAEGGMENVMLVGDIEMGREPDPDKKAWEKQTYEERTDNGRLPWLDER